VTRGRAVRGTRQDRRAASTDRVSAQTRDSSRNDWRRRSRSHENSIEQRRAQRAGVVERRHIFAIRRARRLYYPRLEAGGMGASASCAAGCYWRKPASGLSAGSKSERSGRKARRAASENGHSVRNHAPSRTPEPACKAGLKQVASVAVKMRSPACPGLGAGDALGRATRGRAVRGTRQDRRAASTDRVSAQTKAWSSASFSGSLRVRKHQRRQGPGRILREGSPLGKPGERPWLSQCN